MPVQLAQPAWLDLDQRRGDRLREVAPTRWGHRRIRSFEICLMHIANASVSASLRRERLEHGGWPDGQVAQANPDCREIGVADGGGDHDRAGFAERSIMPRSASPRLRTCSSKVISVAQDSRYWPPVEMKG